MIAVNRSREADVTLLLDRLARQRRALVAVEALAAAVGWDGDRFADALADAEDAGRAQTWENPEGELVAVLTPLEAQGRGLVLTPDSLRWMPARCRPDSRHYTVRRKDRTIGEDGLDLDEHGTMSLDGLPAKGPSSIERLIGEEKRLMALHLCGPKRTKRAAEPQDVLLGDGTWPLPNTRIKDIPTPDAGVVRDLVVMNGKACPACSAYGVAGRFKCVVCDTRFGRSVWFNATIGTKKDAQEAAAEAETDRVLEAMTIEIDPKTGRRIVKFDQPPTIKFQPRSRGAKRGRKTG